VHVLEEAEHHLPHVEPSVTQSQAGEAAAD
jgi:hypothetical protein